MPHFTVVWLSALSYIIWRCAACATAAERIYLVLRWEPLSVGSSSQVTGWLFLPLLSVKSPIFRAISFRLRQFRARAAKSSSSKAQKPASRMSKTGLPPGWLDSGAARIPTMSPVKNNTQKERETHTQRTRRWSCMSSVKKNNQHLINCSQHADISKREREEEKCTGREKRTAAWTQLNTCYPLQRRVA